MGDSLDGLTDRELAYVLARVHALTDTEALRRAGIGRSTYYRWSLERREDLNGRALRLQQDMTRRALVVLEQAVEDAARRIAELVAHDNPNVALRAAQDVLDRVTGRAVQRQEVASEGVGHIVVDMVWDDAGEWDTAWTEAGEEQDALGQPGT